MDRDRAKKANELIKEIDGLKKYKSIAGNSNVNKISHFEFRSHYGNCDNEERIIISKIHNNKFFKVLENIINELEQELLDL